MNEKKPKISKEDIEKTFTKLLGKEIYGDNWTPETNKQIYEEGELEKKLLSGYWYRLGASTGKVEGQRQVIANTGIGGVKEYIQACKRQGMINEDLIASNIEVYIDGQYVKLTDPRLHHINLKDNAQEDNKTDQQDQTQE